MTNLKICKKMENYMHGLRDVGLSFSYLSNKYVENKFEKELSLNSRHASECVRETLP